MEPYYEFRMEIPAEFVGRALTDIQRMAGEFQTPDTEGDFAVITGSAPVSEMRDYQLEVTSYTKGRGRLFCTLKGYAPCHNAGEVIEQIGYDSEGDLDNPTGSVFCAHGAGFMSAGIKCRIICIWNMCGHLRQKKRNRQLRLRKVREAYRVKSFE